MKQIDWTGHSVVDNILSLDLFTITVFFTLLKSKYVKGVITVIATSNVPMPKPISTSESQATKRTNLKICACILFEKSVKFRGWTFCDYISDKPLFTSLYRYV